MLLIQSNGGVMSLDVSRRFSVNTVLSGPAAGVIAARAIAEQAGFSNVITCDMGGTSLDIALVAAGQPTTTSEINLAYGIPIRVPMLDITTLGAGGGSIAWIDRGGYLQIGPHSAGADPGPACYGRGGQEPTVTDANLVLGRINAASAIGSDGGWQLDVARAQQAIDLRIGRPLGLSPIAAARAIVEVANARMAGSIRMISVERGHDPRDFVLVAFGGAGPLHAAALLRALGLGKVIMPYYPGLTSAPGVRHGRRAARFSADHQPACAGPRYGRGAPHLPAPPERRPDACCRRKASRSNALQRCFRLTWPMMARSTKCARRCPPPR